MNKFATSPPRPSRGPLVQLANHRQLPRSDQDGQGSEGESRWSLLGLCAAVVLGLLILAALSFRDSRKHYAADRAHRKVMLQEMQALRSDLKQIQAIRSDVQWLSGEIQRLDQQIREAQKVAR